MKPIERQSRTDLTERMKNKIASLDMEILKIEIDIERYRDLITERKKWVLALKRLQENEEIKAD